MTQPETLPLANSYQIPIDEIRELLCTLDSYTQTDGRLKKPVADAALKLYGWLARMSAGADRSGRIIGRRTENGLDIFQVSLTFGEPFEVVRYQDHRSPDKPEAEAVALKDAVPVVVKELRAAAARIGDAGLVTEAVQYGLLAREIDRILGEKK